MKLWLIKDIFMTVEGYSPSFLPLCVSFNKPATIKFPLKVLFITQLLLQVYCIKPTVGAAKVFLQFALNNNTKVQLQQE